jgi:hypothetical protein
MSMTICVVHLALAHRLEDRLELRDDEREHQQQHERGDGQDRDRVGQGTLDARLDRLALRQEAAQAVEDLLLHAARLARAHHVGVERVEHPVVLGHRFGQRRAALDVLDQRGGDALHAAGRQLALEDAQALGDRDAGVEQHRELARELGEHARRHAVLAEQAAERPAGALVVRARCGNGRGGLGSGDPALQFLRHRLPDARGAACLPIPRRRATT